MPEEELDPKTELNSNLWTDMSLQQLYTQETLMQERIDFALRVNNVPLYEQLRRGMMILQSLIIERDTPSTLTQPQTDKDPTDAIIIDPYATTTHNKRDNK